MDWVDGQTLEPVWQVPTLDGKGVTDRISIKHAEEFCLIPRVTGIIDDVLGAGWGLQQYIRRTCILAAAGNPMEQDEHEDDYIDRVSYEAARGARKARDRGRQVHSMVARFLERGEAPVDTAANMVCEEVQRFLGNIQAEGIDCEKTIGNSLVGYAGTPDIYIENADLSMALQECGIDSYLDRFGEIIIDLKTVKLHKFRKPYDSWKLQFGGYGNLRNIGEDSLFVQLVADPWTGDCKWLCYQDVVRWRGAFTHIFEAWCKINDFDPRY